MRGEGALIQGYIDVVRFFRFRGIESLSVDNEQIEQPKIYVHVHTRAHTHTHTHIYRGIFCTKYSQNFLTVHEFPKVSPPGFFNVLKSSGNFTYHQV
jgi:hypothetical protein